ncbi:prepilin-type N-terminal cleavage/methylation domain-containing protein [Geminisphaera colitermitum]|uniref:prepilin-type N-terminal cleavage/methylation domain-containing protein n=1 Tax=Geminisphaera colitermitum TaxID=1148786 RepID=UPI00019652A8|nr:prepilin-type N-terminal cleavage/methylation domain-containing protein [Geminisphaera colitermitum]
MKSCFYKTRNGRAGFTLIELLAVITIIGVLAAIIVPTVGLCRRHAYSSRETSAARQLMVAYYLAAEDERGRLMQGELATTTAEQRAAVAALGVTNETGGQISMSQIKVRWAHRLRPYLGNRFRAVLYVNEQAEYYDQLQATQSGWLLDYHLTLSPSFGMNEVFVGGGSTVIPGGPVRRLEDAEASQKLIVFTSSINRALDLKSGFFRVQAPYTWTVPGDPSEPAADASLDYTYGYVAFRHGGGAVVGFLDGHVERLRSSQLRDMRLWSNVARLTDNPSYSPNSDS